MAKKPQPRVKKKRASPRIPAAVLKAYRATTYRVEASDGHIDLRHGAISQELDRLLAKHGEESWAFITAWNPRSKVLDADANARRQAGLVANATEQGYRVLPGVGIPATEEWMPERSCLVIGIPEAAALRLGASADQYAILAGRRGKPAKVLSCLRASVSSDPVAAFLQADKRDSRDLLVEQVEALIEDEAQGKSHLEKTLGDFIETGAWLSEGALEARAEREAAGEYEDDEDEFLMTDSLDDDEGALYSLHRIQDDNGDSYVALLLTYGGAMSGVQRSLEGIFFTAEEAKAYLRRNGRIDE